MEFFEKPFNGQTRCRSTYSSRDTRRGGGGLDSRESGDYPKGDPCGRQVVAGWVPESSRQLPLYYELRNSQCAKHRIEQLNHLICHDESERVERSGVCIQPLKRPAG